MKSKHQPANPYLSCTVFHHCWLFSDVKMTEKKVQSLLIKSGWWNRTSMVVAQRILVSAPVPFRFFWVWGLNGLGGLGTRAWQFSASELISKFQVPVPVPIVCHFNLQIQISMIRDESCNEIHWQDLLNSWLLCHCVIRLSYWFLKWRHKSHPKAIRGLMINFLFFLSGSGLCQGQCSWWVRPGQVLVLVSPPWCSLFHHFHRNGPRPPGESWGPVLSRMRANNAKQSPGDITSSPETEQWTHTEINSNCWHNLRLSYQVTSSAFPA